MSVLRRLGWALLALVGLLLVAALAWVATQGPDAEPRPLPAALRLPPPAPPGPVYARLQTLLQDAQDPPVEDFRGPPLDCGRGEDCAARWSRDVAAVAGQLERHAGLRARCEAVQAVWRAEGAYVEWVPERLGPQQPVALSAGGVACQRWLIGRALVAAAAGDEPAAVARLLESREWAVGLLQGSRTLIGHLIAQAQLHLHLQAVAAVALLQPGWAAALEPAVAPWPDALANPARWMPYEAAFGRGAVDALDASCRPGAQPVAAAPDTGLFGLLCRHRLGWHPEATRQALDAVWLARIERLRHGPEAWLEAASRQRAQGAEAEVGMSFRWRNTWGHGFASLGQDDRLLDAYIARGADAALHRQMLAATLAMRRAGVPAPARAAWLAREGGLPPAVSRRVSWEADGRALRWRSWADELGVDGAPGQPPVPARIALEQAR